VWVFEKEQIGFKDIGLKWGGRTIRVDTRKRFHSSKKMCV